MSYSLDSRTYAMNEDLWINLKRRFKGLKIYIVRTIIFDSLLLCIWVLMQYIVESQIIKRLELSGINHWVLLTFQVILALSTLILVIVWISVDIRVSILIAKREIKKEIQGEQNNDAVLTKGNTKQ